VVACCRVWFALMESDPNLVQDFKENGGRIGKILQDIENVLEREEM